VNKFNIQFINNEITNYIQNDDIIIADTIFYELVHRYGNNVYLVKQDKSMSTVMDIIKFMDTVQSSSVKRVVVIGGGLVKDIASFTCSIYKNGVEWIYFPTTLSSMSDCCIGGKNSLSNQIGSKYEPSMVYINTEFLTTLNLNSIRSGLIEILKMCMIGNVLELYVKYKYDINTLIKLSVLVKRSLTKLSTYDSTVMTYGHTIGHTIEVMSGYTIPHDVASVYGMLVVNKLFSYDDILFEDLCKDLVIGYRIGNVITNFSLTDNIFVVPKSRGNFQFIKTELTSDICEIIKMHILKVC
jgi:3-dehydroquinate synthase